MNLIQLDVQSVRKWIAPWGIPENKITSDWHNGNISIIIECEVDTMTQEVLLSLLEANTSISIPVVFKQPAIKDFKFNFSTVP